jgi:hypothetical protein
MYATVCVQIPGIKRHVEQFMSVTKTAQQAQASKPAPQQQQGQVAPAPQQQAGAPVIRDWASI